MARRKNGMREHHVVPGKQHPRHQDPRLSKSPGEVKQDRLRAIRTMIHQRRSQGA
jgi:hypothetical protein